MSRQSRYPLLEIQIHLLSSSGTQELTQRCSDLFDDTGSSSFQDDLHLYCSCLAESTKVQKNSFAPDYYFIEEFNVYVTEDRLQNHSNSYPFSYISMNFIVLASKDVASFVDLSGLSPVYPKFSDLRVPA